jgi:hypothetical protein
VVERSKLASHLEGLVERGIDGAGQAEMLGNRGQCSEDGKRIGAPHNVEVVDLASLFTLAQTFS